MQRPKLQFVPTVVGIATAIGTVLGAQVGYPFTGAACAFVVAFGLIVIWGGL